MLCTKGHLLSSQALLVGLLFSTKALLLSTQVLPQALLVGLIRSTNAMLLSTQALLVGLLLSTLLVKTTNSTLLCVELQGDEVWS